MPQVPDPNAPSCPVCGRLMGRNGKTAAGVQRWKCRTCKEDKTEPASDRKAGRPRKWVSDAERMRAKRAKKKSSDDG